MQLKSIDTTGKTTELTVSDAVFSVKPNKILLAQAIRVYLANRRQGTSDVKTRSEVARTTKKWFKQKGTGNARHGSRKAPIFVGGGIAHGPKAEQNWSLSMSTKARRGALATALSMQASKTVVMDAINKLDGKTSTASKILKESEINARRILVIINKADEKIIRSLRNLSQVVIQTASRVTALEVAMAKQIVITPEAIALLEKRIGEPRDKKLKEIKEVAEIKEDKKEVTKVIKKAKVKVKEVSPKKAITEKKSTVAKK